MEIISDDVIPEIEKREAKPTAWYTKFAVGIFRP